MSSFSLKRKLLATAMLLSISSIAHATTMYQVSPGVSDGILNIRLGPSPEYGLVGTMPAGAFVQVYRCVPPQVSYSKANWCELQYNGLHGWASTTGMFPAVAAPAVVINQPFTTSTSPTDFQSGNFVCSIVGLIEGSFDADQVMSIDVDVTFKNDNTDLATMSVVHNTGLGHAYSRSSQYDMDSLSQTPGKLEVTWTGTWRRDSSVSMIGRLWNDRPTGVWYYSELQSEHGQLKMKMLSACKPTSGD